MSCDIHAPNCDIFYPYILAGNSNLQPSPTASASNWLDGTVAAITSSSVNATLVLSTSGVTGSQAPSPSSVTTVESSSAQVVLNLNFYPLLNDKQPRYFFFLLWQISYPDPSGVFACKCDLGARFGIRAASSSGASFFARQRRARNASGE